MPNLLRQYRTRDKLSQRELARRTGISQPTIQRIEVESTAISEEFATKLAGYFDTPLTTLFPVFAAADAPVVVADPLWCRFNLRGGLSRIYHVPGDLPTELSLELDDMVPDETGVRWVSFESNGLAVAIAATEIVSFVAYEALDASLTAHDDPIELISLYPKGERDPDIYPITPDSVDVRAPGAYHGCEGASFQDLWRRLQGVDDAAEEREYTGVGVPLAADGCGWLYLVFAKLGVIEFPLSAMRPALYADQTEAREREEPQPMLDYAAHADIDLNAFPETRRFLIEQANRRRRLKDLGRPTDTEAELREAGELSRLVEDIRARAPA